MKEYPYLSQAIGNTIEILRKDRGMTKSALADFAWQERRYLLEICEALRVSPLDFFRKVEDERERLARES